MLINRPLKAGGWHEAERPAVEEWGPCQSLWRRCVASLDVSQISDQFFKFAQKAAYGGDASSHVDPRWRGLLWDGSRCLAAYLTLDLRQKRLSSALLESKRLRRFRAERMTTDEAGSSSTAQQSTADRAASTTGFVIPAVCIALIATPIAAAASPVAALNQSRSATGVRRRCARRIRTSLRRRLRGRLVLHQ